MVAQNFTDSGSRVTEDRVLRVSNDDVIGLELQIAGQVVGGALDWMADRDVQITRLQLIRQGAGAAEDDFHGHLRQLCGHPLDDGTKQCAARGRAHADTTTPAWPDASRTMSFESNAASRPMISARSAISTASSVGRDRPVLAIEELRTELDFQVGDAIAQGRLRHPQRFGRLAIAACVADRLDVE